jgi:hypothetical protein
MALTTANPYASTRQSVRIPRIHERPWEPLELGGGVRGPVRKTLHRGSGGAMHPDPSVAIETWLSVLPPGWVDHELVYHPCVEEGFVLDGEGFLADRPRNKGWYLYRPPGILHGPAGQPPYAGRVMIQRFGAGTETLLRYDGDEFPHADSQPVTDEHREWPVTWVESLDSNALPWTPVEGGPWDGAAHKWLSRNTVSGGGTLLIQLPAGWSGTGTKTRGSVEELVVEGEVSMGGELFERWGYAARPIGDAAGSYGSTGGATLICFWDENELGG